MSIDLYQPCWKAFVDFNADVWTGKALHINADSGEYVDPFVTPAYALNVKHDSARQVATSSCTSEVAGLLTEGFDIIACDEFDATEDGAYSLDREMVSVPGISGPPARLAIEMSLPVSTDERVRCSILYDSCGRLSRIIVYEETRQRSRAAASAPPPREPLTLATFVGSYTGDALSRRTWRLGGGTVRFSSRSVLLWDGGERVRREVELTDTALQRVRTTTWGTAEAYSNVVRLDGGGRLILLPGGCWVSAPEALLGADAAPLPPLTALDALRATAAAGGGGDDDDEPGRLDEILREVGVGPGGPGGPGRFASFVAEFGVCLGETARRRVQRLYDGSGRVASVTTVREALR